MKQDLVVRNYMPDRMTYARLGKTNFLVSRIGVGGYANHGMKANADTMADADPDAYLAALQYLLDNGVNFIETALIQVMGARNTLVNSSPHRATVAEPSSLHKFQDW